MLWIHLRGRQDERARYCTIIDGGRGGSTFGNRCDAMAEKARDSRGDRRHPHPMSSRVERMTNTAKIISTIAVHEGRSCRVWLYIDFIFRNKRKPYRERLLSNRPCQSVPILTKVNTNESVLLRTNC